MTELDQFWPACLARLEAELSSQQFNTWIKPLAAEANEEGIALFAPNRFIMQFIKDRFLGRIEELAVELVGEAPVELRLARPAASRWPCRLRSAMACASPHRPATSNDTPARPSRPR
jgi:chromosomal replication initiator protein